MKISIVLGLIAIIGGALNCTAQTASVPWSPIATDRLPQKGEFPLFSDGAAAPLYFSSQEKGVVRHAVEAYAKDVHEVAGIAPAVSGTAESLQGKRIIVVGTVGESPLLKKLIDAGKLDVSAVSGKWESASINILDHPFPGVDQALVIAGSDPRGAAYALFDMSRAIGVSPLNWWADVPAQHHKSAVFTQRNHLQAPPAVQFRGIFLNDEDWGLRPWASQKMDPSLKNIGPRTYERMFELLLRLHANTLWPAMHPGSAAFNTIPDNAPLANEWGIVMGSSHSEALLRNNVGEWNEKQDGRWNYQVNREAIDRYWEARLKVNGHFDNFYTVGMRGVHDSGLQATGTPEVKARLLEQILADQRKLLAQDVNPDVTKVPQVIWLYKEAIDFYRVGMKVPDDVTLGWTDDNFGYIRQFPTAAEQKRSGGSGLYYHISYWGAPHDYLWLCTTPPALMREELTKAWDHGVRKVWIANVGDLKPAETGIDYFLQLAWREPEMKNETQLDYLRRWSAEQFPARVAGQIAELMDKYYQLSFVRKPEFMGFNDNNGEIHRTDFNPLAWGDQNRQRLDAWESLRTKTALLENSLPASYRDAYFELVAYPIEGAAYQNEKLLWNDRRYLDTNRKSSALAAKDEEHAKAAYEQIQSLTTRYNTGIAGGKWDGMMSSHPRTRHSAEAPPAAVSEADASQLPATWAPGTAGKSPAARGTLFTEKDGTISMDAAHFAARHDSADARWVVWPDLGLSGSSVSIDRPGLTPEANWIRQTGASPAVPDAKSASLDYAFSTTSSGEATASIYLLPTFPIDADHRLRYAVSIDGKTPVMVDAAGAEQGVPNLTRWASNVLRNAAIQTVSLGTLAPGKHTLRLIYGEPGVVFEHITVTFPGAVPGYPFAPETH